MSAKHFQATLSTKFQIQASMLLADGARAVLLVLLAFANIYEEFVEKFTSDQ
jgi:hypothetical protein